MATTQSEALDRFERALRSVARRLYAPPKRTAYAVMVTGEPSCADRAAYVLLSELGRGGPKRVTELAASLGVDVSTVSRKLHELASVGLVRRLADPDDGRAVRVELSVAGAAELDAARAQHHQLLGEAMSVLTKQERELLVSAFERLAEALDDEPGAGRVEDTDGADNRGGADDSHDSDDSEALQMSGATGTKGRR